MDIHAGHNYPLGARVFDSGVNFCVYSKNARAVELLLFNSADESSPTQIITLDPTHNRTYHYWHAAVSGLRPGQIYAYRVHGPYSPSQGLRFNSDKVLLDPYGRGVVKPAAYSRMAACGSGDNTAQAMKSVVVDARGYNWEGDEPLHRPYKKTVIYEMHVGGFTRHPNSGVAPEKRGTYAGLIEKIPYLKDLGITAVELLPVFQFDEQDAPAGLANYWGYSPISFFMPHRGYSSNQNLLGPIDEFRDMVKALHLAGIEVILDVVFNHTSEGNEMGPTQCFRGFENESYYMLSEDPSYYQNYTGCGNTLNTNHPVARRMILDSLRYWVRAMHVDGFRFDLASILSRDENGAPLINPPVLLDIESDPVLSGTKLIAEAWDAGGLYQVGNFVGDSWQEWNGKFRDDVRSYLKSDAGAVPKLSQRLLGSPDLFERENREPEQSINFITCHDGFTLNDLVTYNGKHNEANGENNRDGSDDNLSWNCGVEGPTADPEIERLRSRQVKNALAITMISVGTPMILMGDEVRRTQRGNNNGYCQDSELSWFDWSRIDQHKDVYRFAKRLIAARLRREATLEKEHLTLNQMLQRAKVEWHGARLYEPSWAPESRQLACTFRSMEGRVVLHAIFNAFWEVRDFELPAKVEGHSPRWHRWIDTALDSPKDICKWIEAEHITALRYPVQPRSVVVLFSEMRNGG